MITIRRLIKIILVICGCITLLLGIIGIFVPLLPTTPFVLLAAACFSRSSEKFYNKLIKSKWLGQYIKNYRDGKGIPIKAKVFCLLTLWITIGYSALFLFGILWVKILLLLIAVTVTIHILSVKTPNSY